MEQEAKINTTVEVFEGPNAFGAQFYGFSVDFSVIHFPDESFNSPGPVELMYELADTLTDTGWTQQGLSVRAAANELDRQILGTE
jgi:hypothetical protein